MLKNQVRLSFFKEKIFYWKILNILKVKSIPHISRVLISFNIRNIKELEDVIILKFFYYLEVISKQKTFLKKLIRGNIRTKMKNLNITGQVTLRNFKIYNFLEYYNFFIYPILKKNFIKVNTEVDSLGNLSILIKDLAMFPGLTEELNNKVNYPVKIDVIFNSSNTENGKYFLKEFGFE